MMATDCISRSKDVCQIIKFAAREQVIDVCIVPSQSATDQKVVPLLPLRKNLVGREGTLCRCALRVKNSKLKPCVEEQSVTPKGSNTKKAKARQTCSATSQKKRKCLDISEKITSPRVCKAKP